jgi:hypothetical protein
MNHYIERVSLTGADDSVELSRLIDLTARYPHAEWALLYVPHNEGAPRNPQRAWREAFFSRLADYSAVHLCGALAFEQLLQGALPADILEAPRMQLNINARKADFSDAQVLEVFSHALTLGPDIILQYHPQSAAVIERFAQATPAKDLDRVHILMDASRGTGLAPQRWTQPEGLDEFFVGYAGGIGPMNIQSVLQEVTRLGRPCWVDMESGVRSGNEFDLDKAEAVLRAAAEF